MAKSNTKRLPIVSAAELQHLLGVSLPRVYQLVARPDFPEPWVRLRAVQVWRMEDIEAWAQAEGRALTALPQDWPPARDRGGPRPRGDAARRVPKQDTSKKPGARS
jgi:predicted DNA-binding transcriptional regulator AlpA